MPTPPPVDSDPIALAVEVLRSRSGFLVMREAFYGTRRFDEFERRLAISPSSLANRLRSLVEDGLLERVAYQEAGSRTRREYLLTEKGRALLPSLLALAQWGATYVDGADAPPRLTHAACGAPVSTEIRCASGHRVSEAELVRGGDAANRR